MDVETTDAVRQAGNLQDIVNQQRVLLEGRATNEDGNESSDNILSLFYCLIL
jgi:hypothetical protein